MDIRLSLTDLLLFAATTILILTLILLLNKINLKNYLLIGTLSAYFIMITLSLIIILTMRFNYLHSNSVYLPIFISTIFSLHNLFHYFTLQLIISKNTRFKAKKLIHFIPILILGILIYIFFKPIYSTKEEGFLNIFETQNLMYSNIKNLTLGILRIAHPFVYSILGSILVYSFYKSPSYQSHPKSIRSFVVFFLFQKIALLVWVIVGFLRIKMDLVILSEISITGFSITALIISTFILLNPNLFIQITKPNFESKKIILDNSKLPDLYNQINVAIKDDQLFLNHQYNLTNLSSDTGISATTIREIITVNDFKNYSAFINSFRIDYAKNLIRNGYLDTFSIESLCRDAGFQSEVTFYRVFKNIQNCTPKEYSYAIKNNLVNSI